MQFKVNPINPQDFEWDAIVIGTGMGGATVGHELCQMGYKVLFIEKGNFLEISPTEKNSTISQENDRQGYWPHRITLNTNGKQRKLLFPIGSGPGGSTILYGGQLERMHPSDFRGSTENPLIWPLSYEDFEPYYAKAEFLYRVKGCNGQTSSPPLSKSDSIIFNTFKKLGLEPYRSPIALECVDKCTGCGGKACKLKCKNDSLKICLQPALDLPGGFLLTNCEVISIKADASHATCVKCIYNGEEISIRARFYIAAAGALITPGLLLKSRSEIWPNGLANKSGLVGKNLMFHLSDFYAIKPKINARKSEPQKSISTNYFYENLGIKMGTFQSVGIPINSEYFFKFIIKIKEKNKLFRILPEFFYKVAANIFTKIFEKYTIFASIVEDYPDNTNKISIDDLGQIIVNYEISQSSRYRNNNFRKMLKTKLKKDFSVVSTSNKTNINLGHATGTCRLGIDPSKSVLDINNRCHDLSNLYICDSSFFVTSSGVNPSLTIAANAIRVAEHIARHSEFKIT